MYNNFFSLKILRGPERAPERGPEGGPGFVYTQNCLLLIQIDCIAIFHLQNLYEKNIVFFTSTLKSCVTDIHRAQLSQCLCLVVEELF